VHVGRAVGDEHWSEKKLGQDSQKSQKGYISPIWGEAAIGAIYIKIV